VKVRKGEYTAPGTGGKGSRDVPTRYIIDPSRLPLVAGASGINGELSPRCCFSRSERSRNEVSIM